MDKPARRINIKTSIGGQAVMEGIMMRGPTKWCLAVRVANGEIVTEVHDTKLRAWAKIPFIRGILNFAESLSMGYKTLMRSAELSLDEENEEEPSKFDLWIEKHFGELGAKAVMGFASVLGILLAIGLFMLLPTAIVGFADKFVPIGALKSLIEGFAKIAIFLAYLTLVSRIPDIQRVFAYHGAEHKTIFCYEVGDPLTVENIRKHSRFHPRCGTSFLFIVLVVSIFLNSALPWPVGIGGTLFRVLLKLLVLPLVMAISYELLRFAGRHDNFFTRALSAPGMWIQRLTTKEPDNDMIEVAIAAVSPVLPKDPSQAVW